MRFFFQRDDDLTHKYTHNESDEKSILIWKKFCTFSHVDFAISFICMLIGVYNHTERSIYRLTFAIPKVSSRLHFVFRLGFTVRKYKRNKFGTEKSHMIFWLGIDVDTVTSSFMWTAQKRQKTNANASTNDENTRERKSREKMLEKQKERHEEENFTSIVLWVVM